MDIDMKKLREIGKSAKLAALARIETKIAIKEREHQWEIARLREERRKLAEEIGAELTGRPWGSQKPGER